MEGRDGRKEGRNDRLKEEKEKIRQEKKTGKKKGRKDRWKKGKEAEGNWAGLDLSVGRFWPTGLMFNTPALEHFIEQAVSCCFLLVDVHTGMWCLAR